MILKHDTYLVSEHNSPGKTSTDLQRIFEGKHKWVFIRDASLCCLQASVKSTYLGASRCGTYYAQKYYLGKWQNLNALGYTNNHLRVRSGKLEIDILANNVTIFYSLCKNWAWCFPPLLTKKKAYDGNCVLEYSWFLAGPGCSFVQVQAARPATRWSVKLVFGTGSWSTINKQLGPS